VRELSTTHPWINLRFLLGRNILLLVLTVTLFRFLILSTSYLIPNYLTTVQNFRSLQVGEVLIWIALPQFLIAPLIAALLGHINPRIVLAFGATVVGIACLMATNLTSQWQTDDFLPSQILQAVGQSSALIAMVLFFVRHLRPADALTFGAVLQTARLFGAELGSGFMQTFVRVSEQTESYLLGLHVQRGGGLVTHRLAEVASALVGRSVGEADASARSADLLAQSVRVQANVLATIDGFQTRGRDHPGGLVPDCIVCS
jgi:MFS transporter, DHA2 family, multidrug resistance protein